MPGPVLSMHLAQFHPALDTYRLIPVRDMRDEARDLMAGFRGSAAFQEAKRRRVIPVADMRQEATDLLAEHRGTVACKDASAPVQKTGKNG